VVGDVREELAVIPGNVPNLIDLPAGCRFAPRCTTRVAQDVELALEHHPRLRELTPGHDVRCWVYHDLEGNRIERAAPSNAGAPGGPVA
jgi:oligopeptide/dipeptide ABC transporter ATP-binding protein